MAHLERPPPWLIQPALAPLISFIRASTLFKTDVLPVSALSWMNLERVRCFISQDTQF